MRVLPSAFLILVSVQAVHSIEEFIFRLWDFLAPARYVSRALSIDPAVSFAIANTALVLFGLICWLGPVRRATRRGRILMWGWAILEFANGLAHLALATNAGGYFPGLYTAPLLILASVWLIARLIARAHAPAR